MFLKKQVEVKKCLKITGSNHLKSKKELLSKSSFLLFTQPQQMVRRAYYYFGH